MYSQLPIATVAGLASLLVAGAKADDVYDYVIVGGGTSGLVVANRLSEDPDVSVAVIEPGSDTRGIPTVEAIGTFGIFLKNLGTFLDWQHVSVPQPGALNRSLGFSAGKAVGGTSTINGMTYIRGDKAEIDTWETLGSEGWNWDSLLPYYKSYEHFDAPTKAQEEAGGVYEPEYHGEGGPLHVGFPYELTNGSLHQIIQDTWENLSLPLNRDLSSGSVRGFGVWPQTINRDADIRWDAAKAYYWGVQDRPNLKLLNSTATKIVWKDTAGDSVVADGVENVGQDGVKTVVRANKEVILSAGALTSPLLLEASGIGNAKLLESLGVNQVVDLPGVGENLQDQPNASLMYEGADNITGMVPYVTFVTGKDVFGDEFESLAASTETQIPAWAKSIADASANQSVSIDSQAVEKVLRVQHDLIFKENATVGEILISGGGTILATPHWNLLPFSRGNVHLGSSLDVNKPVIDPRFFLVDFDLTAQIKIGRLAQKSWATSPVKEVVVKQTTPNDTVLPLEATDEQWKTFTQSSFGPNAHPLGTAALMSRELGGVVDSQLKVYGTKNVRVVDASVIPLQVSGHLTSTLYAIAERAAEMIKKGSGKCK